MHTQPLAVFDLDGTLADTAPDLTAALNVALQSKNLAPLDLITVRHLVGGGARVLVERGLQVWGVQAEETLVTDMVATFLEHYKHNIARETVLFPEIPQTLRLLAEQGYALAICTNKPERMARQLIEHLGYGETFTVITGGDTFAYRKPDARHLLGTIAQSQKRVSHAVMIGDSRTDYEVAKNACVPAVLVPWGYHGENELEPGQLLPHNIDAQELVAAICEATGQ